MSDIFISYKREEQPVARKLADALQKKGWSVWWDPKMRAGEHFDDAIEKALNDAKCVLVMWSKLSVKSRYVKDEATYALNRNKLVPIAIEEVDLPFRFEGIQTERLINWDGSDSFPGFKKLVADIAGILGEPPIEVEKRKQEKDERKRIEPLATERTISDLKTVLSGREEPSLEERIDLFVGEEPPKTFKNSIGMEFMLIPAGSFMMGSKLSPEEVIKKYGVSEFYAQSFEAEHPQHKVTISKRFYLQSTPVTQNQWQKVVGDNPSLSKDRGDDCPVEQVSWDDAQGFIKKLNEMDSTDNNYRLPTEAEWEYTCRAGTTTEFFFGDDAGKLGEYAWYKVAGGTRPVGRKEPNAWGLYDMHGNVWEWAEDDWHENYKGAPADGSAFVDKPRGAKRVNRGGDWGSGATSCRAAGRNGCAPDYRNVTQGFRLSRSIVLGP